MDYEIEWDDGRVAETREAVSLSIDGEMRNRRYGFIDVLNADGEYLFYCAFVEFEKVLSKYEWHSAMQTILMLAKARYGL